MSDAYALRNALTRYRHIIPCGFNCGTARLLQAWELRRVAYPFDWMFSNDPARLVDLLLTNCHGMFDDLEPHDMANDHGIPSEYNPRLGILFNHHLPSIPIHRETLERRIVRLYETLDRHEPTAFVRLVRFTEEATGAAEQESRIRQRWPQCDLLLFAGDHSGYAPTEATIRLLYGRSDR